MWEQLEAADAHAVAVASDLTEEQGIQRPGPSSWSVSECLDHLATANDLYLRAMEEAAGRARARGRLRRGAAEPGIIGRLFVRLMEPRTGGRIKMKAPPAIRPSVTPLASTLAAFLATQEEARRFLDRHAELDLAGVRFRNPFVRWIRFSIATGLNVIVAHDRRHLLQASRARREIDPNYEPATGDVEWG